MMALLTGIVGVISTILAWQLNPRRRLYAEIDRIEDQLEVLYVERDRALATNDSDALTRLTDDIVELRTRKSSLLQRLG